MWRRISRSTLLPTNTFCWSDRNSWQKGFDKFASPWIRCHRPTFAVGQTAMTIWFGPWMENRECCLGQRKRTVLRNRFLKHFLDGQNVLQHLKEQYPMLYEIAVKTKESRAEFLRTASLTQDLMIFSVLQSFATELLEAVKGVDRSTAELLAHGAVAEWLLLCPLQPSVKRIERA